LLKKQNAKKMPGEQKWSCIVCADRKLHPRCWRTEAICKQASCCLRFFGKLTLWSNFSLARKFPTHSLAKSLQAEQGQKPPGRRSNTSEERVRSKKKPNAKPSSKLRGKDGVRRGRPSAAEIEATWIRDATMQMTQLRLDKSDVETGSSYAANQNTQGQIISFDYGSGHDGFPNKSREQSRCHSPVSKSSKELSRAEPIIDVSAKIQGHGSSHDLYADMEAFWHERRMRLDALSLEEKAAEASFTSGRCVHASATTSFDTAYQDVDGLVVTTSYDQSLYTPQTAPKPKQQPQSCCAQAGAAAAPTKCCRCCAPQYCLCVGNFKSKLSHGKCRPRPKDVVSSRAYKVRGPTVLFLDSFWRQPAHSISTAFISARKGAEMGACHSLHIEPNTG